MRLRSMALTLKPVYFWLGETCELGDLIAADMHLISLQCSPRKEKAHHQGPRAVFSNCSKRLAS